MNKTLPAALALVLPVTTMTLIGLGESPARADVIPICVPIGGVPECNDGEDNDSDGAIDTADTGCVSSSDYAEGIAGYQAPCQRVDFILWEQFLRADPWPPDCPECGLTLIDIRDLLTIPPEQLIRGVHPDWEVSVVKKLQQPVQGIFDDPRIPNLRLRFAGNKLLPPSTIGTLFEFNDPSPQPSIQYVGRAFDARTGKQVTNIGLLNAQQ
jgi:hypothetical protein